MRAWLQATTQCPDVQRDAPRDAPRDAFLQRDPGVAVLQVLDGKWTGLQATVMRSVIDLEARDTGQWAIAARV